MDRKSSWTIVSQSWIAPRRSVRPIDRQTVERQEWSFLGRTWSGRRRGQVRSVSVTRQGIGIGAAHSEGSRVRVTISQGIINERLGVNLPDQVHNQRRRRREMRVRQSAASARRRQPAHAHQANRSWASRITPQGCESHPSLKNHLRSKLRTRGCKVSRALEPVLVKMNLRAQGRPTPSTQSPNALPRPLPAAFVTLAPVADRAALILEPAPFAPRMRQRGLVAPIEQKNDEIECAVGLAGFGARES